MSHQLCSVQDPTQLLLHTACYLLFMFSDGNLSPNCVRHAVHELRGAATFTYPAVVLEQVQAAS
jgi:hypothetical protein